MSVWLADVCAFKQGNDSHTDGEAFVFQCLSTRNISYITIIKRKTVKLERKGSNTTI